MLVNSIFIIGLLGGSFKNLRKTESKQSVIIKAVLSFVIWLALTGVMIVAAASYFYGDTLDSENRTVKLESATVYFIMYFIIWTLSALLLVYWINHSDKKILKLQ